MHDLQLVEEEVGLVGLQLNHRKTQLICDVASTCDTLLSVVSELRVNTCGQATLLGTPIGSVGLIDATTSKTEKLKPMGEKSIQPRRPYTPSEFICYP